MHQQCHLHPYFSDLSLSDCTQFSYVLVQYPETFQTYFYIYIENDMCLWKTLAETLFAFGTICCSFNLTCLVFSALCHCFNIIQKARQTGKTTIREIKGDRQDRQMTKL